MNALLKVFLSLSVSGSLLILILFLGKRFWRNHVSRQWQYYIWLIVLLRLLLPFGLEPNLPGNVCQAAVQAVPVPGRQPPSTVVGDVPAASSGLKRDYGTVVSPTEVLPEARPFSNAAARIASCAGRIWLAAALGLLIRKITVYQGFIRYLRAGLTPVSHMGTLDQLSIVAERVGVKQPVELCVHPLVSSPMLIGFFRPCIVLPRADIPEQDVPYIFLHELIHHKRRDLLYKWLVQITVCLHWFNPFAHWMSREIARACEFSCDEAVLSKWGDGSTRDYGKTLLDAMAETRRYQEHPGAVTLSENKQLLKERLEAIMNFKKTSIAKRLLTGALTLCVALGAVFAGVSPAAGAETSGSQAAGTKAAAQGTMDGGRYAQMTERSYEAGSLPLFQMAFRCLDGESQGKWLSRIYEDRQLAFMGAAVSLLGEDCDQIRRLAETIYEDGDIAFFSVLTAHMSRETLEIWLDRALEDDNWAFQSLLFPALGRDDELDGLEKQRETEWEKEQMAEYAAVGVVMEGKDYYYQGQLVNIFLDIRPNRSFYTLHMNPKGIVDVKIVRSGKNEVTGAARMTEAEVTELLGDLYGGENESEGGTGA